MNISFILTLATDEYFGQISNMKCHEFSRKKELKQSVFMANSFSQLFHLNVIVKFLFLIENNKHFFNFKMKEKK